MPFLGLRGGTPRKLRGDHFHPRGGVSETSKPIVDGRLEIGGRWTCVVAYVSGHKKAMKQFRFLCRVNGIGVDLDNPVQRLGGDWTVVYEIWGLPDALDRIVSDDCVKEWHLPVAVRVPLRGSGAGKVKKTISPRKEFQLSDVRYTANEVDTWKGEDKSLPLPDRVENHRPHVADDGEPLNADEPLIDAFRRIGTL